MERHEESKAHSVFGSSVLVHCACNEKRSIQFGFLWTSISIVWSTMTSRKDECINFYDNVFSQDVVKSFSFTFLSRFLCSVTPQNTVIRDTLDSVLTLHEMHNLDERKNIFASFSFNDVQLCCENGKRKMTAFIQMIEETTGQTGSWERPS